MKDLKQAPVNHIIILVNIVIFLMVEITGSWENADHMLRWGATGTLDIWENHEYYRLFTAMFLHFGLQHLGNNMLVLLLLEIAWKETWEKSDTDCYIYWEEREQICFLCFRKYAHMNM